MKSRNVFSVTLRRSPTFLLFLPLPLPLLSPPSLSPKISTSSAKTPARKSYRPLGVALSPLRCGIDNRRLYGSLFGVANVLTDSPVSSFFTVVHRVLYLNLSHNRSWLAASLVRGLVRAILIFEYSALYVTVAGSESRFTSHSLTAHSSIGLGPLQAIRCSAVLSWIFLQALRYPATSVLSIPFFGGCSFLGSGTNSLKSSAVTKILLKRKNFLAVLTRNRITLAVSLLSGSLSFLKKPEYSVKMSYGSYFPALICSKKLSI